MQHILVQGTIRNLSREGLDKTKACPSICVWFSGGLLKRLTNGIEQFSLMLSDINVIFIYHVPSNSVEVKVAGRLFFFAFLFLLWSTCNHGYPCQTC